MSFRTFFILSFSCLSGTVLYAQSSLLPDSVSCYGSLRALVSVYENKVEMQNNSSRIGINLGHKNLGRFTALAKLELGVNLLKNNNTFRADAATAANPQEYLTETVKPFTTRIGYVGFSAGNWGTLLFGKQWSVFYDITSATDQFNVFGANASGTFNLGTDGGTEGTGRAESAITYRNCFDNTEIGLQLQIPGYTVNYGVSVIQRFGKGFSTGIAFNDATVPPGLQAALPAFHNRVVSVAAMGSYKSSKTSVSLTLAFDQSEYEYPTDSTIIEFSGAGVELYASHHLSPTVMVTAGLNYLIPTGKNPELPSGYRKFLIPLGLSWNLSPHLLCFTEAEINRNVQVDGSLGISVITFGLNYDFTVGR
jgi:predicted porin